jgi:transcriptional regulator with XRE-family HTH domain
MTAETLSKRLAFARGLCGLSVRALERAAKLGSGHVWKVEAGQIESIAPATVTALAKVLGVSPAWLMLGEGSPPAPKSQPAKAKKPRRAKRAA